MQSKGRLAGDGAFVTLTFQRSYRHTIEHVWDAVATADGVRAWLLCEQVSIDGRAGGRIEMISGPARYHSSGKILTWEPPRIFEYEWTVAPVPEMPHGERAVFRYELNADGEWTHLVVTINHLTRATAGGFLPGMHAFLDRLEAELDGAALPEWIRRFGELQGDYQEWTGDAATPGK
jgi:uncharacterized protein YndB with AHSA1/START domain